MIDPIIARHGNYSVKLDAEAEADADYPWMVLDSEGDVWEVFETRKEAIEEAKRQAIKDKAESLRDQIGEAIEDLEDLAKLESILALLNA